MTIEPSATEPAGESATEVAGPRKRRRWPWLVAVVVVVASAIVVAVVLFVPRDRMSAAESARADLAAAQLVLINEPGVHVVGDIRMSDDRKSSWGLPKVDLRVTNLGDAVGTLTFGSGLVRDKTMSYLRIGDKTFLRGDHDAWMAYGMDEISATSLAGRQVLQPNSLDDAYHVDVASDLTPSALGWRLDPGLDMGLPVLTRSVVENGRRVTLMGSGGISVSVSSGHIFRVSEWTFDGDVTPMTSDDVAAFYRELRPVASALDSAVDLETELQNDAAWSGPCAPSCAAITTVTAKPSPFMGVSPDYTPPVPDIFVEYSVVFSVDGVPAEHPDCSGVTQMPGRGTTTVACPVPGSAGSAVSAHIETRPILGRARADTLLAAIDAATTKSKAKAACRITSTRGLVTEPGC